MNFSLSKHAPSTNCECLLSVGKCPNADYNMIGFGGNQLNIYLPALSMEIATYGQLKEIITF